MNTAEDVLAFWFGDSPQAAAERPRLWFGMDPQFDEDIRRRFGVLPERAAAGEFDGWMQAPRSALALVIILDQFPRNLFRDNPQAFQFDAKACTVALAAIDARFDHKLHLLETVFLYLPLEHAEDIGLQNRSVELMEQLRARVPPEQRQLFAGFVDYAHRHRAIIERFGRFPHRNGVLGRVSTPEESAYLAGGGETFSGQKPK